MSEYFPSPELVQKKVEQTFAAEDWTEVWAILRAYKNVSAMSIVRIQLAALKNCRGDIKRLRSGLLNERNDPRDVIAGAEYPRQMSRIWWKSTAAQRLELEEQDRREYLEWLNNDNELPTTKGHL